LCFGTDHSAAFREWWEYARGTYLDLAEERLPQLVTMYYDPLLDVHHKIPISPMVGTVTYLLPLVPEDARRLFDGALAQLGDLEDDIPVAVRSNPLSAGTLLHAAREWGLDDLAKRLQAACDESLEPTWDRERGEFTWGCRLNEEYPRGQFNALLAAGEANSKGAWTRIATQPMPDDEAVVEGIDFPMVALSEARWVDDELHLTLSPQNETVTGQQTSFRVIRLDEPSAWTVSGPATSEVDGRDLMVTTQVGEHSLIVRRSADTS